MGRAQERGAASPRLLVSVSDENCTLQLSIDVVPPVCHVILTGELDVQTGKSLRSAIDRLLVPDCTTVSADLAGLTFIDSAGLQSLVALRRELEVGGRRLELRLGDGVARRLFDVTGLTAYFAEAP